MIDKEIIPKNRKKGQSLVEYGLILALISIVAIAAMSQWGKEINSTTQHLNNALNSVNQNINTST